MPLGCQLNFQSFVLVLILTIFLMLVIISVATSSKEPGMFSGLASIKMAAKAVEDSPLPD
jgi:hypothetical protein